MLFHYSFLFIKHLTVQFASCLYKNSGRGDEVRERVEKFNRESKNKGLLTIGFFIAVFFYLKITNPYVPPV